MLGLSTSLLDINKKEEKEVKLRKISKTKRLSSEQIADLFNVTAGVSIMSIIPSASLLTDCRTDPGGGPYRPSYRPGKHQAEESWLQTEHQC